MLSIFSCAILYAVKGGQLGHIKGWNELRRKNSFMYLIMDGKILSSIGFGILAGLIHSEYQGIINGGPHYEFPIFTAISCSIFWLIGVSPAMGHIVRGIGGYLGNWDMDLNPYFTKERSKDVAIQNWKTGLQRGVFLGAMLALSMNNTWFIVMGALFPVTAWIGVSIEQLRTNKIPADWHWHEILYGAVLGIGFLL